jgi:hypothetical protein
LVQREIHLELELMRGRPDRGELRQRLLRLEQDIAAEQAALVEIERQSVRHRKKIEQLERRLAKPPKRPLPERMGPVGRALSAVILMPLAALLGATSGTMVAVPVALIGVVLVGDSDADWPVALLVLLMAFGALAAVVLAVRSIRRW